MIYSLLDLIIVDDVVHISIFAVNSNLGSQKFTPSHESKQKHYKQDRKDSILDPHYKEIFLKV